MAINKVLFAGLTLLDLTDDTVTADKLLAGYTAHAKNGERITGTCDFDADTSDATATAADIAAGKTAYAGGVRLTGTLAPAQRHSVSISVGSAIQGEVACDILSGGTQMGDGERLSVRFSPSSRAYIESVTATMGGESFDLTSYIAKTSAGHENASLMVWTVADLPVTGDLVLTVSGSVACRMSAAAINGTVTSDSPLFRPKGGSAMFTLTPNAGYRMEPVSWNSDSILYVSGGEVLDKNAVKGRVTVSLMSAETGEIRVVFNSINLDVSIIAIFQPTAAAASAQADGT